MMKNLLSVVAIFILTGVSAQEFERNQLLVKIKNEVTQGEKINFTQLKTGYKSLDSLNRIHELKRILPIGNSDATKTFLLEFKSDSDVLLLQKTYQLLSNIDFVEPNFISHGAGVKAAEENLNIPNDTYFLNRQWGLYNTGNFLQTGMTTTLDADVDMELAWDIETGNPNLIIAVADSGLNLTHEDIQARIWNKASEIPDGIDNDNNGLIDDFQGWDWVNNDNNPSDDHGHGTNCTGIIGSIANNSKGYTGVNWNSKIMPLKVLNSANSGNYANMANSMYYAAANGAKVISMSIGGTSSSSVLSNAILSLKNSQVLLVVCMMNNNNEVANYPAAYSTLYDNVIAVGSTDANDKRTQPFFWSATSGSNYGNHINVVAPGNFIYGLGFDTSNSYSSYWGGTSQATPLVAGIASLIFSKNPSLTPAQVRSILQSTAEDQKGLPSEDTFGFDKYHGYGRVNAFSALSSPLVLAVKNEALKATGLSVINPVGFHQLEIFVNENKLTGSADLQIITFDGRIIGEKHLVLKQGKNTVPVSDLIAGSYILTIKKGDFSKIYKITVKP
ncbi:hypothetical protein ASG01_10475 [Chryseobacterium sp. Leaf180]|uniref:S8 family serine peptidase n=1 Tax=Chryseobacterium sp. Leaf180 TaxID=1736289 RepID=UPI0006F48C5B|nr:S8 family serine peptidase [Chryseobacterium sp. Leaf180]KQR93585.1 hypothetical protein ASG01_10475 [Chryseobacterium sp. Leaf180]